MSEFVTLKQGDSVITVEVTSANPTRPLGRLSDSVGQIDRTLDELFGKSINAHCAALAKVFEDLEKSSIAPKAATLEFGLQVNGEGNFYVVRSAVQATYKVTLTWQLTPAPERTI